MTALFHFHLPIQLLPHALVRGFFVGGNSDGNCAVIPGRLTVASASSSCTRRDVTFSLAFSVGNIREVMLDASPHGRVISVMSAAGTYLIIGREFVHRIMSAPDIHAWNRGFLDALQGRVLVAAE